MDLWWTQAAAADAIPSDMAWWWMQAAAAGAIQADIEWTWTQAAAASAIQAEVEWMEHINAELLRVASDGLYVVDECQRVMAVAIWLDECLRAKLMYISDTFRYVKDQAANSLKQVMDDLELHAANSLKQVDELLREQTTPAVVKELKLLQLHAQDVAVLACSRFIDTTILQKQGIPDEMFKRLAAAFTKEALQDDYLWSRLGNSKHHVVTQILNAKLRHRDPAASSSAAVSSDLAAGGPTAAASSSADLEQLPVRDLAASSWEASAPPGLPPPSVDSSGACGIDIVAELVRVAGEGLYDNVIWQENLAAEHLAFVKETFMVLRTTPAYVHSHSREDDLEQRAARALMQIDELIRKEFKGEVLPLSMPALEELKWLQRQSQDLTVLICSRFIDKKLLQTKGMPPELQVRLQAAFIHDWPGRDDTIKSRMGHSKYHVFTDGVRFAPRMPRKRRSHKRLAMELKALKTQQQASCHEAEGVVGGQ